MPTHRIYLSLGSNLGERADNLDHAVRLVAERVGKVLAVSPYYDTAPVGFDSDNRFLNAAAVVDTSLAAHDVLATTQAIERDMGRTHKSRGGIYADRIIDLDILLSEGESLHDGSLLLPHPRMDERLFVLRPLADIAPDLVHPVGGMPIAKMLRLREEYQVRHYGTEGGKEPLQSDVPFVVEAVNNLLPHLTEHAQAVTQVDVEKAFFAPAATNHLYLLLDARGAAVGMATLCLTYAPTGCKAWVEDVVLLPAVRGSGLSRMLILRVMNEAQCLGAKSLNLTSRPQRVAANTLYRKMGFALRETNVYKCNL